MADEELSEQFFDVGVHLARTELEATLNRYMRECFRIAKLVAQDVAAGKQPVEKLRQMDEFVRKAYVSQPHRIAEWEEIMKDFDLSQEVVDDGK